MNDACLVEPLTSAVAPALVVDASQEEQPPRPAPMTWIGLIDRVISGWHTMRTGILLIIVLAALITIIVVSFGTVSTPFIVGAGGAVTVAHRRLIQADCRTYAKSVLQVVNFAIKPWHCGRPVRRRRRRTLGPIEPIRQHTVSLRRRAADDTG